MSGAVVSIVSSREAFVTALLVGPMRGAATADALMVLSGDGKVRLDAAVYVLRVGAAHTAIVSGDLDKPPHSLTARAARDYLIEAGLHPDRIVEDRSLNTKDSANALVRLAEEAGWESVLLITSPYHMPRAFLSVLASMQAAGLEERLRVIPVCASQVEWWGCPAGLDTTRLDLLADEYAKIEEYGAKGDVASYEDGLAYLKFWEGV